MEPVDRPNNAMASLVNEAIAMAVATSRPNAAEFLYTRGCSLDVIARVLAKRPDWTRIRSSPDVAPIDHTHGGGAQVPEIPPNQNGA